MLLDQFIDGQFRRPTGLVGRYIGGQMARDHRPENEWTVALLAAQPTDHLVEVGFGPGVAVEMLSRIVTRGRIVGVDYSQTMVAAARRRNAAAMRAGHVELRHSDVSALPCADATFDKAFAIHNIYFWPQPLVALTELRRVLKPHGTLVITVLPKERWPAARDGSIGTPDCTPYSGDEIARMMTTVGFAETSIVADTEANSPSNFSVIAIK